MRATAYCNNDKGALPDPGGILPASAADFAVRLLAHLKLAKKGDYVAITAYVMSATQKEADAWLAEGTAGVGTVGTGRQHEIVEAQDAVAGRHRERPGTSGELLQHGHRGGRIGDFDDLGFEDVDLGHVGRDVAAERLAQPDRKSVV